MVGTAESVSAMVVEQLSPDTTIHGALKGRGQFRFAFRNSYGLHRDAEVGRQLSALATGLLTERTERLKRHYASRGLTLLTSPSMATHDRHRRYLSEVDELRLNLRSESRMIVARTIGWKRLRFEIADGTVTAVTEREFLEDLLLTTRRLAAEFRRASVLKHQAIYRRSSRRR